MKQSIQLRLSQQLTMTPQLQQAIRLLQLSMLDLRQEIQEVLDSNVMLENADEVDAQAEPPELHRELAERAGLAERSEERAEGGKEEVPAPEREVEPEAMPMPQDLPVDSEWSDHFDTYVPTGGGADNEDFDLFAQQSRPETLHDHLNWQLNLSRLGERDMAIAAAIVDGIDDAGYLRVSVEELLMVLDDEDLTVEEILAVLHRIQSLDPSGVGARDLRECLLIQMRQLPPDTPALGLAMRICDRHFDVLSKNGLEEIQRRLSLSREELNAATGLIRGLNPRPGTAIADSQPEYVIPDVFVRRKEGAWVVELNPETMPTLRVNAEYAALLRRNSQHESTASLKTHLQEARWFIKSLASRNDTVLKVASKIVELQQDFLEYGEEAMKPLILRDIADAVGLHESTVSRVTTQKYMYTPRGTFEFKYFFSSHVSTAAGGECSSTAIRAFIRKLVAAETPSKPLSDSKITAVLAEQGINVARRTVAKYREAMGIPPSNERKRLA